MEPQLPTPREVAPPSVPNVEYPEARQEVAVDVVQSGPEQQIAPAQRASPAQSAAQPVVLVSDPAGVSQMSAGVAISTDSPAIADDVDVIEKEWVDKAKKIVSATRDDPYSQEKQVSKLQADYLMKTVE